MNSKSTTILGDKKSYENRYVDLGDSHPSWSVWSNDPRKMHLEAYFSDDPEAPGIAAQFNMALRPVLVKQDAGVGDTFLLADDQGRFFLWNENKIEMYRLAVAANTKLKVEDVAARVRGQTCGNEELIRQFWNPTGRAMES
ncbi:hypothetical protein SUNI508_07941 [Seiridium unicorne]|uniref:Uncharacterized protein n=1 Tax=Seiridium unicorne TaxID=138068 RepID=A0ABR2UVH2_9PEZI